MSEPLVTVIIDTYNYAQYVEEAIESVLAQDFPADQTEILVVDDGSTDDTAERVRKYSSRLQYLQKPNGGQASAFNYGIARSHGQIIAFLDGDDYWLADKLSSVVAEFGKHLGAGMVYHPLREYHMGTGEFRETQFTALSGFLPSSIKQVTLFDGVITTGSAFRREILDKMLPVPKGLRIQADAYLGNVAMLLAPVVAIDRALGVYRIHGKNLYFQTKGDAEAKRLVSRIETRREIVKGILTWAKSHGYDTLRPEIQAAILRWVVLAERDEFQLSPPGRIKFFRHLLKAYKQQSPLMTPRIRTVNYLNAIAMLFVGYARFDRLDGNREKITRWLRHGNAVSSYFRRRNERTLAQKTAKQTR